MSASKIKLGFLRSEGKLKGFINESLERSRETYSTLD